MENERTSSPASFVYVRGKSPLILSMCARPATLPPPLYFCASLLRSEGSREVIRGAALIFSKWEWFARSSFSAPSLTADADGARTDAAAALCSMWMETTDWRLERQRERAKKGGSGE